MTEIKILKMHKDVKIPEFSFEGDAGFDIRCYGKAGTLIRILPGNTIAVGTGIKLGIPTGYECQVRPRSGLAKKGLQVANSPGTIDSGYRGEVGVLLYNSTTAPMLIWPGDRIAQLVFKKVPKFKFIEVEELGETKRGEGGFGSSGV